VVASEQLGMADNEVQAELNQRLRDAAEDGDLEELEDLLAQGADPMSSGANGWTILHWAASNAHVAVAERLLQVGADVEARANDGGTPLMSACCRHDDNHQLIEVLLAHGADVRAARAGGRTALHEACSRGHDSNAQALLRAGADIHQLGGGETNGTAVAESASMATAVVMAERGADCTHPFDRRDNFDAGQLATLHALTRGYQGWVGLAALLGCFRACPPPHPFANSSFDLPGLLLPYLMDTREPAVASEAAARKVKLGRGFGSAWPALRYF
jgi:hypothetical protein